MDNEQKIGPKDVFGHILSIIGLYVSVVAFGSLLFGLINIYVPDILEYTYGQFAQESLKWPLAILVIIFPSYVVLTAYLQRDLEKNPAKKELRTRKWLLYFTLFVAALVILGDLVTLIYYFLSGNLSAQFILKISAVLLIALFVFIYYVWNIRKGTPALKDPIMRWFVYGTVLIGTGFILFGFFVSGSPFAERVKRFDERRTQNLQMLQYEIVNFWQTKEALPLSLDALRDDIRGFSAPTDPETGAPYRYRVIGTQTFELCATFKTTNKNDAVSSQKGIPTAPIATYSGDTEQNWQHEKGETCFKRIIDPDRYPPFKQR